MMSTLLLFFSLALQGVVQGASSEQCEDDLDHLAPQSLLQISQSLVSDEALRDPDGIPDFYWRTIDKKGDVENPMPVNEAQALDSAVASRTRFPSLPPIAPLLYPSAIQTSDSQIAAKLESLTRESHITLPDGTTIPYWQTLQYANRNMRLFVTRFIQANQWTATPSGCQCYFDHSRHDCACCAPGNCQCGEWAGPFAQMCVPCGSSKKCTSKNLFNTMDFSEQVVMWEVSSLLRKLLVTDCVKQYIENDPKYPSTIGSSKPFLGNAFSGAIFWKHIEEDVRGSYMRLGEMKSACAYANGAGITFNNIRPFSQKKTNQFIGCYAHEQAHNMGYHHKDRAPGGIQQAVGACYKKKAYDYTTYDLAKTPEFTSK